MVCYIISTAWARLLITLVETAMDPQTITEKLDLSKLRDRPWFVQPAIATEGEGLTEGFGWLSDNIKKMPKYGGK